MRHKAAVDALAKADSWALVVKVRHEHSQETTVLWSDDAENATPLLREAVRMTVRSRDADRAKRTEASTP